MQELLYENLIEQECDQDGSERDKCQDKRRGEKRYVIFCLIKDINKNFLVGINRQDCVDKIQAQVYM